MERRKFIKQSCSICLLGMAGVMIPGLLQPAAAKGKKAYKAICNANNEVIVPLSLFEESNIQVISVKGWDYDMAVYRKEDQTFSVFLLKCTHMDNPIHLSAEGFVCSLHGSTYNKDGQVSKGPAEQALQQYKGNIHEEHLIITP
ncbi:MAG TPA: Rieske (2Fe-2S) protein [Chitinophagaceae bacterium]|nr:Rieske (2Fe-2S) protein [Chitinophagaceae bacterium]